MSLEKVRGTNDFFGKDVLLLQRIEEIMRKVCKDFNISEIRTPMFEYTEVFQRGVGETTDIVQKEMYTFEDRGNRSLTLKPEGTAGVARAFVQYGMFNDAQPTKLFYITPAFRYEKQQSNRYRQFHQFGVEMYGSYNAAADAEVISIVYEVLNRIGVNDIQLKINSLGCNECRKKYNEVLKNFIGSNLSLLCEDCKKRFEKNPLRTLDCKNEKCKKVMENAPSVLECLDEQCKEHFESLKKCLDEMAIPFIVDSKIVRGLDYYTRTVFEFVSKEAGTICGGGRYDNLISQCSGGKNKVGAVGFAIGMERIKNVIEKQSKCSNEFNNIDIYIGSMGEKGFLKAQSLGYKLRKAGICAEYDVMERGFKSQLKYANKINAKYMIIIGENEIDSGDVNLKNMETGQEVKIKLSETIEYMLKIKNDYCYSK